MERENRNGSAYAKNKILILIFIMVASFVIGMLYVYRIYVNSYSEMMVFIDKGDLKTALEKCKSPFMEGIGKRKLQILEATYEKDIDKTVAAITNDVCYGKCYHIVDDWRLMVDRFLEFQVDEQEKIKMVNYTDGVRKKFIEEENLQIGKDLCVVYNK